MSKTMPARTATIPGVKLKHAWVTDTCRLNHGEERAGQIACDRLQAEYLACLAHDQPAGTRYHFVLTIERPAVSPEDSKNG